MGVILPLSRHKWWDPWFPLAVFVFAVVGEVGVAVAAAAASFVMSKNLVRGHCEMIDMPGNYKHNCDPLFDYNDSVLHTIVSFVGQQVVKRRC